MNIWIDAFARQWLKNNLSCLSGTWIKGFKLR